MEYEYVYNTSKKRRPHLASPQINAFKQKPQTDEKYIAQKIIRLMKWSLPRYTQQVASDRSLANHRR